MFFRKRNEKKLTAAIIGCGSIGALKDDKYDSQKTEEVLTIAHAMYNNPFIDSIIFIDTDTNKATTAAKKWSNHKRWKTESYNSVRQINTPIDIVAVCTPTGTHVQVIKDVIKYIKPKVIIAEKPFCKNKKEAVAVKKLCEKNNITVLIDYIRMYDVAPYIVHDAIKDATVYNASVHYTRGLIHEACHAIQLCNYWFGRCNKVIIPNQYKIIDRDKNDPTRMICFDYEYCPNVVFMPVDGKKYSIFEIQIVTSKGIILLKDHGKKIEFRNVVPEPTYGNYNAINSQSLKTETTLTVALESLIESAVYAHLDDGDRLCSIDDAIAVHDVIEKYNKVRGLK